MPLSSIKRSRAEVLIPPAGRHSAPMRAAASKAVQNPRNGPNEKAKQTRSFCFNPAAPKMYDQLRTIQSQLCGVSSQRSGAAPVLPEECLKRQYSLTGKVRFVPNGGDLA